jgi:hypothetical protein
MNQPPLLALRRVSALTTRESRPQVGETVDDQATHHWPPPQLAVAPTTTRLACTSRPRAGFSATMTRGKNRPMRSRGRRSFWLVAAAQRACRGIRGQKLRYSGPNSRIRAPVCAIFPPAGDCSHSQPPAVRDPRAAARPTAEHHIVGHIEMLGDELRPSCGPRGMNATGPRRALTRPLERDGGRQCQSTAEAAMLAGVRSPRVAGKSGESPQLGSVRFASRQRQTRGPLLAEAYPARRSGTPDRPGLHAPRPSAEPRAPYPFSSALPSIAVVRRCRAL